ncbi:MAG: YebC/PmpR family DNA-binding transcriptional regulator [Epsilonproteobacteria bacterium]|nr:YebC/PmpR family DNA-binding transcriptional regulator [Campylobacterota bacterium]
MGRAFEYRKAAKLARWGNMSKLFPKLQRAITIAAKQGGGDPETNAALRTAILNAKAQNLPKAHIEAAIKRATSKDMDNYQEVVYEGKGPHGVLVVVEAATDNPTRTIANIRYIFSRAGGQVLTTGSLDFMFDRKAVFEFNKTDDMDLEELELELIDAGLEELEEEDGVVLVSGDYKDFGSLQNKFEELGIELVKAELQRLPNNPQEFTPEERNDIEEFLSKLDDDDDVQHVYTNMA